MSEILESFNPGWITTKDNLEISESFSEIIKFFIFGTPCENVSSSGIRMLDRGWKKDVWKNGNLRTYLLISADLYTDKTYKKVTKLSEMSSESTKIGLNNRFHTKREINKVLYYTDKKNTDILTIFYYIRCALAHGRFQIYKTTKDELVYVLESITKKRGTKDFTVKARMILHEKTLVNWIKIILEGEDNFKNKITEMNVKIQDKIKDIIKSNQLSKKDDITQFLDYDKNYLLNQFNYMIKSNVISYDKSKRIWLNL